MYPYIRPGDECRFVPLQRPLAEGEIGLAVSDEGVLFSHRLHRVSLRDGEACYTFRGDGNFHPDEQVLGFQIIGVLTDLKRRGRTIRERSVRRRGWSRLVVRIPKVLKLSVHLSRRKTAGAGSGGSKRSWASWLS